MSRPALPLLVVALAVFGAVANACADPSSSSRRLAQGLDAADAGPDDEEDAGAPADADGDDEAGCAAPKVLVCHVPPGNPANAHTICIGEPALSAHRGHGDPDGACGDAGPAPAGDDDDDSDADAPPPGDAGFYPAG